MNLVAISTCSAPHKYILHQINAQFPLSLVLRPSRSNTPVRRRSFLSKIQKLTPRKLYRFTNDRLAARRGSKMNEEMGRLLHCEGTIPAPEPIGKDRLHANETLEWLRALNPDVLIVSGGPLLKPSLFQLPRFGAINVHFGIAPKYRGENTLFWPLLHEDFTHLGVTIHKIDKGIDTGKILGQGFCTVEKETTEAQLWVQCARMASELILDWLDALPESANAGLEQTEQGTQYNWQKRTFFHDLRLAAKRRLKQTTGTPETKLVRHF